MPFSSSQITSILISLSRNGDMKRFSESLKDLIEIHETKLILEQNYTFVFHGSDNSVLCIPFKIVTLKRWQYFIKEYQILYVIKSTFYGFRFSGVELHKQAISDHEAYHEFVFISWNMRANLKYRHLAVRNIKVNVKSSLFKQMH